MTQPNPKPGIQNPSSPPVNGGARGGGNNSLGNALGTLLRIGVLTAAAIVLLGGALYLVRNGTGIVEYHDFLGDTATLRSLGEIVAGALALNPPAIIQFGVLLLIATPVARVLFALLAFVRERDLAFVAITLLVLGTLLYGFLGGKV